MRIDAHVHFMPPCSHEELVQFCRQEPFWGLLVAPGQGKKTVQGWATPERMLEDMDLAGIDKVVIQGEYRLHHESCVVRNDQALALMRRWPDRVTAFATLQPQAGDRALDELKRCLDGGMLGVGELNPYGQGYAMDDPDFLRLVEACITHDVPLNLHANEAVGHYYPGKSTTPLWHYYRLACRYPDLKLILAHWGGGLVFYEMMSQVKHDLKNVWYDTAASPLLYPTVSIFNVALACVEPHKILFGSDYPLLLYPRTQKNPDFRPFLEEIECLGLQSEVYQDVMGRNTARLLGLDGDEISRPYAASEVEPGSRQRTKVATGEDKNLGDATRMQVAPFMAVSVVAENWPSTRPVFARYDIPYQDQAVPFWEPIVQAAAAQGMGPDEQERLLCELNEAIDAD